MTAADLNDDMVAEVAVASQAQAIVTHNVKDFDAVVKFGVRVLSPGEFLVLRATEQTKSWVAPALIRR